jgi:hypothetical protein
VVSVPVKAEDTDHHKFLSGIWTNQFAVSILLSQLVHQFDELLRFL